MKYVVTRTSDFWGENPQCPNAQKEIVQKDGELVEAYTIELNTLEELCNLSKEVGNPIIVFTKSGWGFDIPELEIYDDYRE
jgi:hypothetical protein